MGSGDDPSFVQQSSAARQLFGQESSFYERHLPGMRSEACWVTPDDTIASRVQFAAAWNNFQQFNIFSIIPKTTTILTKEDDSNCALENLVSAKRMCSLPS